MSQFKDKFHEMGSDKNNVKFKLYTESNPAYNQLYFTEKQWPRYLCLYTIALLIVSKKSESRNE